MEYRSDELVKKRMRFYVAIGVDGFNLEATSRQNMSQFKKADRVDVINGQFLTLLVLLVLRHGAPGTGPPV